MGAEHLKPFRFQPGDSRINRAGRPKSFDCLRQLAQAIAHEDVGDGISRVEQILRNMADGTERQQLEFLAIAYGRPPANAPEEGETAPMRLTIDMRATGDRDSDADGDG